MTPSAHFYWFLATFLLFCSVLSQPNSDIDDDARYFSVPMHEVIRNDLYLTTTEYGEVAVAYADRSSDFKVADYITHAGTTLY